MTRMATRHDSMVNPRIESLLDRSGSKFTLVTLGSTRARQINAYFNKLADGQGGIPPQVASSARKPLSIAFEEIAEGLIVPVFTAEDEDADGAEGAEADAEAAAAGGEADES
jgi:DNA-directed RNA polymerase subunit omega